MQQMIYVIEGVLKVTLYDEVTEEQIVSLRIQAGDVILLRSQAHGVEFIEDSLILETKQGPFPEMQPDALLKQYTASKAQRLGRT